MLNVMQSYYTGIDIPRLTVLNTFVICILPEHIDIKLLYPSMKKFAKEVLLVISY